MAAVAAAVALAALPAMPAAAQSSDDDLAAKATDPTARDGLGFDKWNARPALGFVHGPRCCLT
jgi:hypothetical protein